MTIETILRNRLTKDLEAYLAEAREHEDNFDDSSIEERVQDFYLYMYNVHKEQERHNPYDELESNRG